jgi:phage recombination protein Bet
MTVNGTIATREEAQITQHAGALAIRPGQEMWNDKQRAALSVLGIRNASNADLAVFMHYCQKTGLDPFSRQIYMICRREKQGDQWVDKQTIQVGIDGFRVIRDRIAARLGVEVEYEDTIWYDSDGGEHAVWLSDTPPAGCRVVVLKNGRRFPAVLRTSGYAAVNKDGQLIAQWRTQPDHMIEKCAEAFALRRAFPHDLGGIYLEDEMPPAERIPVRTERVTPAEIIGSGPTGETGRSAGTGRDESQRTGAIARLAALLDGLPLGEDADIAALVAWKAGRETTLADLTPDEVGAISAYLAEALEVAGGDVTEAASAIWTDYRTEHPEAPK